MFYTEQDYAHFYPDSMRVEMLLHEAGHVLGIGRGRSHGDGSHCRNRGCLMRAYEEVESELVRLLAAPVGLKTGPRRPCRDCQHDVESSKKMDEDKRLSCAGPFLVRRQEGYAVVRLPYCEIIDVGVEPTFRWPATLERTKRQTRKLIAARHEGAGSAARDSQSAPATPSRWRTSTKGKASYLCLLQTCPNEGLSPPPVDQVRAALTRAGEDPCPITRTIAHSLLKEMESRPIQPMPATATPEP
jgi:hypothetical protein